MADHEQAARQIGDALRSLGVSVAQVRNPLAPSSGSQPAEPPAPAFVPHQSWLRGLDYGGVVQRIQDAAGGVDDDV